MQRQRWIFAAAAAVSLGGLACTGALAQDAFPAKPVRAIVPLTAGSAIDVFTRAVGNAFEARTKQPFVVENRAGANTIIAANACKGADPDGYTICLLTRSSVSINPEVYRKLSYDPLKDFEPVIQAFTGQQIVILNTSVPARSMAELVAYSKANPEKMNFGSLGTGGDSHLVIEWLKRKTGASITHVPFKGATDALQAFAANNIQMIALLVGNPGLSVQIKEGKIHGLVLLANQRSPIVPNVPTLADAGIAAPDTAMSPWFGFFAPRGTPKPIVAKLNAEIAAIVKSPEFRDRFLAPQGFTAIAESPETFARFLVEDRKTAAQLVEISGVKINE